MKQKEIGQKLSVLTQSVSSIKIKLEIGHFLKNLRSGKYGGKKKTTPALDCKIKNLA